MEVSCWLHTPAALPPGEEPWYPLDRIVGPQKRSGHGGEEKKSKCLQILVYILVYHHVPED